uniref:transcription factor bHLH81-like n=1 Tax=Erigeron canadensis TaxID=72917 RepID=UPI001CB9A37D|nr:transcription factor bHLH81-like [Erigeron canadensis]
MQPTSGGTTGAGLSRFRSAPATWLEALLESEEDEIIDPPKPIPLLPPHTSSATANSSSRLTNNSNTTNYFDHNINSSNSNSMFVPNPVGLRSHDRQNSLPAEFLSQINTSDAFMSNYSTGGYHVGLDESRVKFTTQLSGDQSALLDVEMDKLLGDSVPCRVRAKRGCATHPRSIAERVRRTRISDRIRKLQELVPNMDKQTNTADMLEEAVEYVKFLQGQIQELRVHRDKCTCLVKS